MVLNLFMYLGCLRAESQVTVPPVAVFLAKFFICTWHTMGMGNLFLFHTPILGEVRFYSIKSIILKL